ncbi:MAG: CPBP family intramembrane metalloprotease [Planctomycetes bacterium]|nr:CPBP family intramembrane metalloprotease [Planctomycetota bacterium]
MNGASAHEQVGRPPPRHGGALLFALAFPTLVAWIYFILLAEAPAGLQRVTYAVGKIIQFAFPVLWVWRVERRRLFRPISVRGTGVGIAAGVAVVAAMFALYFLWLQSSSVFQIAGDQIRKRIASIGIDSGASFAVVGLFYVLMHSGFEEYYWRWFVFRGLRERFGFPASALVSSLGFMSHHVLVLGLYFGAISPATALFSAAVAIGGAIWAWVYEKCDSLVGPWISHALVDAGIFIVGYDIAREVLQ